MRWLLVFAWITVSIVVSPSEGFFWRKKDTSTDDDIKIGLVKQKKPPIVSQPILAQDLNPETAKDVENKVKMFEAKKKPAIVPPPIEVDAKLMSDPNSQAVVLAGTTAVAAAQNQINKNNDKVGKIENKINELETDLENKERDDSLSDLLETMLKIQKQRMKLKWALGVYSVVNLILYVAESLGSWVTPPIGKMIYGLDFVMRRIARKPINNLYANYAEMQADLGAKWLEKHEDVRKNVKLGKQISITTHDGKILPITILKVNPGDKIDPGLLNIVDKTAFQQASTTFKMKR